MSGIKQSDWGSQVVQEFTPSKARYLPWLIAAPLAVVLCFYAGVIAVVSISVKTPIEKITLDDNHTIEIWSEADVQHPGTIYYEIAQGDETIVPATMLMTSYKPSYDIRVAFAQNKTLVCVYDSEYGDRGLLILYNTQTGKAWPGRDGDHEQWRIYYAQLRDENPSLPVVDYLMMNDE